jgi:maltose/moltooligosaccharide transporter
MGVFNFFIVLPQIAASLGLGYVMKLLLGGNTMNAVLFGGASLLIAAVCVRFVDADEPEDEGPSEEDVLPVE